MKAIKSFTAVTLLLLFSGSIPGQTNETNYDSLLKSQLDDLGMNYIITKTGDFQAVIETGHGRLQAVTIRSSTQELIGIQTRYMFSMAVEAGSHYALFQDLLIGLLERNQIYKIGAWEIEGMESPFTLEFGVIISANETQSTLDDLIKTTAKEADEMEQVILSSMRLNRIIINALANWGMPSGDLCGQNDWFFSYYPNI